MHTCEAAERIFGISSSFTSNVLPILWTAILKRALLKDKKQITTCRETAKLYQRENAKMVIATLAVTLNG